MKTKQQRLYWLHAISPLHVGSGRGEGYIDLPLQREKTTNFPILPGSAVKGVVADYHGASGDNRSKVDDLRIAFGMADGEKFNSGALVFTDARLICLPIASIYGTFAWCSSPMVLRRFQRDLSLAGHVLPELPESKGLTAFVAPAVDGKSCAVVDPATKKIYLDDLDLTTESHEVVGQWAKWMADQLFLETDKAWRKEFQLRFVLLPDDVFKFVCETGTEVQAHIRIDDDHKRVVDGALWYEESLPAETIMAGLVWCDQFGETKKESERDRIFEAYCKPGELSLQMGGKATVGKGRVRCVFSSGQAGASS